ncbi:peptide-methionine (S)-S-oxide reductase MsrA [Aeromicrobium sp. Leaf350]|uniref:peptide-methionine (S)-S-oxide reductase MsrA n=1 Tax=Aeromicrobium sp. Leaf350 TaxID=2876565 RepID=UPI001E3C6A39|nr:peptide-methionine (S)-S-oxide reductase MsrA [Aeromicrobium sp. Leaf350]
MIFGTRKTEMPAREDALPGRPSRQHLVGDRHLVTGNPLETDGPEGFEVAVVGLGCFWGEEQTFWQLPGVWSTTVGYAGGYTPNPTYEEVCTGRTGHSEVVRVVFDPAVLSYDDLLATFWENHDPTQGMRQGNDRGSQYRSVLLTTTPEQQAKAETSREHYQQKMSANGYGRITTEIKPLTEYYYAEDYHQQYLVRNPHGYCPLHATGVSYA